MKRIISSIIFLGLLVMTCISSFAAEGNVTYNGDADKFIVSPGSDYSPTDLFTDLKGVMPGDVITQKITVKNMQKDARSIEVYLRSLGGTDETKEFLSQLTLTVKCGDKEVFQGAPSEPLQLSDWVSLGTLIAGASSDLELTLTVPVTLDSKYNATTGYVDWEFRVDEIEEKTDSGDHTNVTLWVSLVGVSLLAFVLVFVAKKKAKNQ